MPPPKTPTILCWRTCQTPIPLLSFPPVRLLRPQARLKHGLSRRTRYLKPFSHSSKHLSSTLLRCQTTRFLHQDVHHQQPAKWDDAIVQEKEKQIRTPWHREGAEEPPVKKPRSAGAMTKGGYLFIIDEQTLSADVFYNTHDVWRRDH